MHNSVYNSNKENGCKSLMEHLDVANLKKLEINIHEVEKEAKSLIQDFEKKKKVGLKTRRNCKLILNKFKISSCL